MKWLMIGFIKFWRAVISPSYGDVCKFYPTCSEYGLEAVRHHGAVRGGGLAMWRILRCHPWSKGGYDPVPGTKEAYLWELEQAGELTDVSPASSAVTGVAGSFDHTDCFVR